MVPNISIVIPVYNIGRYIGSCLNSISGACLCGNKVEVIIVDDGSTDNSWDVIEKACAENPSFRAIRHEKNLGVGPARNTALDHCMGDYVWFVDGDDTIDSSFIPEIINLLKKENPDIFVIRAKGVKENGDLFSHENSNLNCEIGKIIDIDDYYIKNYRYGYTWMYICRMEKITRYKFRFKDIRFMQDVEFYSRLFVVCKYIYVSNIYCYNYLFRESSSVNERNFSGKVRRMNALVQINKSLNNTIASEDLTAKMRCGLKRRLCSVEFMIMWGYLYPSMTTDQSIEILKNLTKEGIYPFRWRPSQWSFRNIFYYISRLLVNYSPIKTRKIISYMYYNLKNRNV